MINLAVNKLFTTTQAAKILGVSTKTVQIWCDRGVLRFKKTDGGHRRISGSDLQNILSGSGSLNIGFDKDTSNERLNVLIVDDDLNILTLYREHLEDWVEPKINLTTTDDAHQALILVGRNEYDVIITDIKMPGIDGAKMINILNESHHTEAKIIVVTALDETELKPYKLPKDIHVFEKPISFNALKRTLIATMN